MAAASNDVLDPGEVEAIVRTWIDSYSAKDFETHNGLVWFTPTSRSSIRRCASSIRR